MNTDYGDLGVNGPRLEELVNNSRDGAMFIDLGVRMGVSSRILLQNAGKRSNLVFGIDVAPRNKAIPPESEDYHYARIDSVTALANMTDQLGGPREYWTGAFVDTLHIEAQVLCELYYLWPMIEVGGWVALHDTEWPIGKCDHYLGREWPTPDVAVEEYFGVHIPFTTDTWHDETPDFSLVHYPVDWGMTVVTKKMNTPLGLTVDWERAFSERNQLLALLDGYDVQRRELMPVNKNPAQTHQTD